LNTRFAGVKDAAAVLAKATGWQAMKATSSANEHATVSASNASLPGSLSFTVDRLAAAHSLVSVGTVSGTAATVVAANSRTLVGLTGGLGIDDIVASAGLAVGSHTLAATQASAGASQTGSNLAATTTIGAGQTIEVAVDGTLVTTHTVSLTAGTYNRAQLAAMITSASGGLLSGSVSNTGALSVSTVREGSAANLAVTGGSGLGSLGLSVSGAASSGTNGIITVNGIATTVTDLNPGNNAVTVLDAGGGNTISVTFARGIRVGSVTAKNIDLGDGSLAAVVAAINAAGAGVSATAVQVAPGKYRMQLTASAAGTSNSVGLDHSRFGPTLGVLENLASAVDASITVGTGTSSYQVTAATNAIEVMAGVTINLVRADPAKTVTVNVSRDPDALATKVQTLVASVNDAMSYIADGSKYDSKTKTGGPLLGNSTARDLQSRLYSSMGSLTTGVTLSTVGITIAKNGTIAFDKAKFTEAFNANPAAVEAFFSEGGPGTTDDGLAARLETLAKGATDTVSGLITISINGNKSTVARLQTQIDEWDKRLTTKEANLRKVYSALEANLGKLQSRSNWLSGQLTNLNANTSG
jgi:flagellar hook-associated protein 2